MEEETNASKAIAFNSILLRAWRERWTDSQWGINMKTVLPKDVSGDTYNLADSIIQQAVVGSDANKLVLSYLRHSLCSRQVSHAAVLHRISKFDGFDRSYCLIALLDFLDSIINGVTCRTKSEESTLPSAMLSLMHWLIQIFSTILEAYITSESISIQQQKVLNLLITLIEKIVANPFLMGVIHVGKQEDGESAKKLKKKFVDIKNVLGNKKFTALNNTKKFEELFKQIVTPSKDAITQIDIKASVEVEPITYCLQPLIAVQVLLNPNCSTPVYVSRLLLIRQLKNYSTSRLYYELMRSALISFHNVSGVSGTNRESLWCAFTFIKVPQILRQLHVLNTTETDNSDHSPDVVVAIEALIDDPILDLLDTKCACNVIEYLLNELAKHNLLNESQVQQFGTRRDGIWVGLSKMELNNPQMSIIKLVKKAESPLAGILKALDGDYNKMQEHLLAIMCQVLSGYGNNFELILSVVTVEGKLKTFVSRLIRCNESSKQVIGESEKAAMNRSALFDVSFLMLTFIVQTYGSGAVLDEKGDSFFEKWVRDYMPEKNKNKSPMNMVHQCEQNKVDEILMSISGPDGSGLSKSTSLKWQDICMNIPGVLYHLLVAWENETISAAEVKTHLDNIKSRQCSFLVCAVSWLHSYMRTVCHDELLKPMNMVQQFLTVSTPEEMNQQENYKERLGLTIQIIRKMQNDSHQNQKIRSANPAIVSQHPLEEQFHDVWKTIADRGWLPINSTQLLDSLLQACGPYWLVSKLVNEILQCKFSKDISKTMDIVFAIMHLNIESCTIALLSDLIPLILLNKAQKFELIEPQLSIIARFCVYCIVASLEQKTNSRKRTHVALDANDTNGRATKLRKVDDPSGDISSGVQTPHTDATQPKVEKIREPLLNCLQNLFKMFVKITDADESSPKIYFVYQFLVLLQQGGDKRIKPVLNLLPPELIQNLLKVMNIDSFNYEFVLKMHDLDGHAGRQGAMSNLTLLRSLQLQKICNV